MKNNKVIIKSTNTGNFVNYSSYESTEVTRYHDSTISPYSYLEYPINFKRNSEEIEKAKDFRKITK